MDMIDPMITTKAIRQTWGSIRSDTAAFIAKDSFGTGLLRAESLGTETL
jgi:hypothetical protein